MVETVKEKDFVEVDYTGKLADGTVFDTTLESVAKENNIYSKDVKLSPAVICVGEKQLLPGLDAELVDKEVGKEFTVTLPPEQAFGKRDVKKVKIVSANTFKEHKVNPQPGLQIEVDGEIGTVQRVSGGRIIVNFNHPLSGREVIYIVKINRKVVDNKEKIVSFLNTSLKIKEEAIKVEIKEKKAEIGLPAALPQQFTDALSEKLVKLTDLDIVEFKGKEEKAE